MKRYLIILPLFFMSILSNAQVTEIINVGVFNENGDSPYCIADAVEAVKIDNSMNARVVSAAQILAGKTKDIHVYIFPGGSGKSETGSLGILGREKIKEEIMKQGKGIIGICAGAYILTNTPEYPSLDLSGAEAIDIEHDHRGNGLVKFSLTKAGQEIFPELKGQEILFSNYYEGPVLIPAKEAPYPYTELATMLSDVHTIEGTPSNMTNNRPFITLTDAGKGKVVSIIGHPESTPGMRWIIPRLVRVVLDKKRVSYSDAVIRPEIHQKEILFTKELREKQSKAYDHLWGTKEEKLKAMQDIIDMNAWSAKKKIPPMMRDENPEVRLLAAKLTVYLERTDALEDLESAVAIEKDPKVKLELSKELKKMKTILGGK